MARRGDQASGPMALLVLIAPSGQSDISLRPGAVEMLARLGVTSISLAQDSETVVVILEGWSLDTRQHEQAAAALGAVDARPLQPMACKWRSRPPRQQEDTGYEAIDRAHRRPRRACDRIGGFGVFRARLAAANLARSQRLCRSRAELRRPGVLPDIVPGYDPYNDPAECPDATDKAFLGGGRQAQVTPVSR